MRARTRARARARSRVLVTTSQSARERPLRRIEALEAEAGSFVLAVQWHPEMAFARHPVQLAPFAAFARSLGVAAPEAA